MDIKLIVTDMDGTFLRPSHTYDKRLFRKLFNLLKENEVEFLVASGGVYGRIGNVFPADIREEINFINDNGGVLRKKGEIVQLIGFKRHEYLKISNVLDTIPGVSYYISTGQQTYGTLNSPYFKRMIEKIMMEMLGDKRIYLDSYDQIPSDLLATKIAVQVKDPHERMPEIERKLAELEIPLQTLTSGGRSIDIIPASSGKGQGVRFFQSLYGIKKTETMAFGDAMNDVTMMDEAAYKIAMGNCDPRLLECTNYKIESSKKQSMQKLLYELFKIKDLSLLDRYKIK